MTRTRRKAFSKALRRPHWASQVHPRRLVGHLALSFLFALLFAPHGFWPLISISAQPLPASIVAPSTVELAAFRAAELTTQPSPPTASVRFDRYSLEQGLSQSSVKAILQDRRGFLWFGTEDGLNRFDGYEFTIFRHDPQDPHSLSNSHIRSLYEDTSGALWVGTYGGGLDRFDPETGIFSHYRHNPEDPNSLSDDQVTCVYGDRSGALWVATRGGGLSRLDADTGLWHRYQHDPDVPFSLGSNTVIAVLEDSLGDVWVATTNGLNRLESETGRWQRYQWSATDSDSLHGISIQFIHEDSGGELWFGTAGGGLNRYVRAVDAFVHYVHDPDDPHSLSSDNVTTILEDEQGVLWVGTGGGLDRFDRGSGRFIHRRHDPTDPHSLSSNQVLSLYQDRAGGLWIGTRGSGVNRYDRLSEQFTLYRSNPNSENSLKAEPVWGIYEDESGILWIGTDGGGLNRLDRKAQQWSHYLPDPDQPNSLGHSVIVAVHQDRSGALWLGTWGAGLDRFDRETGEFTHYRADLVDPTTLSNNVVWSIFEDRQGLLWIGTANGLNSLDPESGQFSRFLHDAEDPDSLSDNNVGSILQDEAGLIWMGTHGGLNALDPDTGRFRHYKHRPGDPESLSHNIVFAIHQDQSGLLWLGTWGGGLNRFDPVTETFTHYRVKDGLPNDVIYGILEDDQGHLWLSTNNGLSEFDPETESFRNYDVGDGLQSAEFDYGSYFESSSGEMFFGGIKGFNAFYPDQIRENDYVPPVVLSSISQGGEPVELGSTPEHAAAAVFRWPYNDFEFEFAALSFYQPERNQYAYLLDGYDDDWNYIGTRRFGAYTNLPGGSYTLRLKGSNNDGVWNNEGISVGITIVPPFWATWWFRGLAILAVGAAAAMAYWWRIRSVEARGRELEQEVLGRTKELAALNSISSVVSRSLHLNEILSGALEKTLEVTGLEAGGIFLLEEDPDRGEDRELKVAAQKGLIAEYAAGIDNLLIGEGLSGRVLETGEPLVVRDMPSELETDGSLPAPTGFRSMIIAPVVSRAKVLGTLFVVTRGYRAFSDRYLDLLASIGGQIGVAVENARLYEQAQQTAVVEERNRLARELHDAVTQTLFSASLIAEALPSSWELDRREGGQLLKELQQLTRGALAEMRTLLLELRPTALVETGLADLLRQLVEATSGRIGIPVQLTVQGTAVLPPDVHVTLYRIAQEALNNVSKHARAGQVAVRLRSTTISLDPHRGAGQQTSAAEVDPSLPGQRVELEIIDDGRGFDPSAARPDQLGLGIMQERAQVIGAELVIDSHPGRGTKIRTVWQSGERSSGQH